MRWLLCILCLTILVGCPSVVVNFPDANLEAAIRQALDQPTGDILDTDLLGLTTLYCEPPYDESPPQLPPYDEGYRITNLFGIEYCTNLTILHFEFHAITDIAPLVNNPGLGAGDEVGLEDNPLSPQAYLDIATLEARGVTVYYDAEDSKHFLTLSKTLDDVELVSNVIFPIMANLSLSLEDITLRARTLPRIFLSSPPGKTLVLIAFNRDKQLIRIGSTG